MLETIIVYFLGKKALKTYRLVQTKLKIQVFNLNMGTKDRQFECIVG